jgi:hypothetical protein
MPAILLRQEGPVKPAKNREMVNNAVANGKCGGDVAAVARVFAGAIGPKWD